MSWILHRWENVRLPLHSIIQRLFFDRRNITTDTYPWNKIFIENCPCDYIPSCGASVPELSLWITDCIWFLLCGVLSWINHCRKYVVLWCKQSFNRKIFIKFYIVERYFSWVYILSWIYWYIFPYPLRVTPAEMSFQHNTLICKCSRERVGLNQKIHYKHIWNLEQVYFYSNCEKVNRTQLFHHDNILWVVVCML